MVREESPPRDDLALWYYKWFRSVYYLEDPKTDVCRDSRGVAIG